MVNFLFYLVFLIESGVLIVFAIKSFSKKNKIGFRLGCSITATFFMLLAYVFNYCFSSPKAKEIFCSLEHVFIDWALFAIASFLILALDYRINKTVEILYLSVELIDTAVIITNPVNHFAADITYKNTPFGSYIMMSPQPLYYAHFTICIFAIVNMLVFLLIKIVKSSKYYRFRYYCYLFVILISMILNLSFTFSSNFYFDYSRLFYGIGAVMFYICIYSFKPASLLHKMQVYISNSISDAMVIYDKDGNLISSNAKAKELFGKEVLQKKEALKESLGTKDSCNKKEINGRVYEIQYEDVNDSRGFFVASTFVFHDITEAEMQFEREKKIADYDSLTGCFNRNGFFSKAKEHLEEHKIESGYAVMISGIRNFKGINGLYGTRVGDMVLKHIGDTLHDFHHEFPMVYGRSAEGKFSSLIPFEYVDSIVNALSNFEIKLDGDVVVPVEMCHGFAVMTDDTRDIVEYYELALLALANCKKKADTVILEYTQDMAKTQKRKQLLLSQMNYSLEKEDFFIVLQPQIDLRNGKISGAEALVRWKHPALGTIPPGEFIELFEKNGFISRLDRYVWCKAAETIAELSKSGVYNGSISVNVSQIDIMNMDVAKEFERIVEKYNIPNEKLHVEITESACVNNHNVLINTMNNLRKKGFVVEIDDFGSGYSSLNALMKLPFDIVKLDMGFMRESIPSEKTEVVIGAVCNMIHNLNAGIIVEGIETKGNEESANAFHGDVGQGYLYSKPISIEEFIEFVKGNS